MGNNKGVSTGTKIYFLMSVVIVFVLNLYAIIKSPILLPRMGGCSGIICCVIALIYAMKGFGKDAAKFYKIFMILAFFTYQFAAATVGININGSFAGVFVGLNCLASAFVLALLLSTDLGKGLSMAICLGLCAFTFVEAIVMFIVYPGILRGGTPEGSVAFFRSCSNFFVAEIVLSMTMAKYQDKAARGTK